MVALRMGESFTRGQIEKHDDIQKLNEATINCMIQLAMHVKVDAEDEGLVSEINSFSRSIRNPATSDDITETDKEILHKVVDDIVALKDAPTHELLGYWSKKQRGDGDPEKEALISKYRELSDQAALRFCKDEGIECPSYLLGGPLGNPPEKPLMDKKDTEKSPDKPSKRDKDAKEDGDDI